MRISDGSSDVCSSDLQKLTGDWLCQNGKCACPKRSAPRVRVGGGCDDDDRDVVVERAQMLEKFDPADPGHLHVGYDAGKAREIIYGQERLRTVERMGSNAGHLQQFCHGLDRQSVVVGKSVAVRVDLGG